MRGRLGVPFRGRPSSSRRIPKAFRSCLRHHWARTHSIDERIVLAHDHSDDRPVRRRRTARRVERLSDGLVRVTARFGFMEKLDIERIVHGCGAAGLHHRRDDTTFYSADPQIVAKTAAFCTRWHATSSSVLAQKLARGYVDLGIPADAHAKLGIEVPM